MPEATVEGDLDNGPVKVTLDTADGDNGSGTVLTQYRVDGGPWKVYEAVDDEVLFDGSEASLQQWRQAPTRRVRPAGGPAPAPYISPVGGLGMLWYPVKQYGDFKFKFQFREGRTDGGFSNGGAFVRFPNPDETPRVHECSKVGSAATSAAWVAINCGHEIQLYDGETGETRKTGSIYTFDNTTLDQAGIDPAKRGEWEDYEIEVVGQHYTIRRNGEVLNEFDNTPGKNSDRAGDPSTTLRQFTEGYIGLQNHGGADTMQYRNMRVEDLTPGVPKAEDGTGPFEVAGRGPHTIEVRTVDAAGNEASETFDVRDRVDRGAAGRRRRRWRRRRRTPVVAAAAGRRDAAADDRHPGLVPPGHDHVAHHPGDVRPPRPVGAGGLHGRDGRLGEADGLERDAQAAEAQERDAGQHGRPLLGPAHGDGDVQAVVGDRQAARPQGRPGEREDDGLGADA